jgi:hypothetical protein
MNTENFKVDAGNSCKASKFIPDQKSIKYAIIAARKKSKDGSRIIIARYEWLQRNKLAYPHDMELPNLCLTIKKGKLIKAFFSNVLTHIIKKQNYYIQILN